ncbi:MAG: phytanoyl-CoA dioxygenase family protein, partial [Gemmatimonadales bacterium]|nr:phytanoyl-CoA dioxygenase family protein [Gemmatimonadales bacterium]
MTEDPYPSRVAAEATMLPRLDPVVRRDPRHPAPIDAAQIDAYERDGFMVLEGVFDQAEVDALRRHADELRDARATLEAGTVIREPGKDDEAAVRSVFAIHRQSDGFAALVADRRLAGLAGSLLGDEVYVHQSRLNFKPAFHGKEFYWHSDFETWHVEDGMPRMQALSMSIMLDDNHPQAGPTMFVPGSHRRYVTCVGRTPEDHYKASLRKQEYGVPDHDSLRRLVEEGGIAAPAPRAGSVVVFDCNTMHGSNGNITPFGRSNAFVVFNAWSNR